MKFIIGIMLAIVITGCYSKSKTIPLDQITLTENQSGVVVLLHGLMRSSYAMQPAARYFSSLGYDTVNISYPSTDFDIPTLVDNFLAPKITSLHESDKPIHFVTHSLGGILVRDYLARYGTKNVGRVVMLAPPNRGTEIVDRTINLPFADPSPATVQLSTEASSWVNNLPLIDVEFGIIAGTKNNNILTKAILPGPDDGVVPVENTKLDNMQDFITVPLKHYHLRRNQFVLEQSAYFVENGQFFSMNMPNEINKINQE